MLLIRLSIETTEPLSGTAAIEGGDPLPFKGWLDLLRVITELGAAPSTEPPGNKARDRSAS
jgi:hypothetical protein